MASFVLGYAHAFQQVTSAQNLNRDSVRQQLDDFAATLDGSRELHEFLLNPSLLQTDKIKVLDALASRIGLDHVVRNFIAVIMDHQRLESLHAIIDGYKAVIDDADGIVEAEIVSARPLSDEERRALQTQAGKLAGASVRTVWREDPTLLGGAVVRIGSQVYDGSVRAQLQQLQQHLAGA